MAEPVVLLDWPATGVARLRINRPDKRNAIDHDVRQGFLDQLSALQKLPGCRALVIGGVGGIFSAGGDIPSMVGLTPASAADRMEHIHRLCGLVGGLRMPVVSAMEGYAAGAAVGLALLGDEIVMGRQAKVLFPFLRLGLVPDWGQVLTLPRRVGVPVARRLLSSDRPVCADEALQIGLVDHLCDDADVMAAAVERATRLAALPAEVYARLKQRLAQPSASLAEELKREAQDQVVCLCGPDFQEGYQAYRDKRRPDFVDRPGAIQSRR